MGILIGTPYARNAGWSHYRYSCDTRVVEDDVQTCPHCQAVIRMRQWETTKQGKMAGGFCMKCSKPICPHCQKKMQTEGCIPFMKKIEKEHDMLTKYSQFVRDAGLEPAAPSRSIITGL